MFFFRVVNHNKYDYIVGPPRGASAPDDIVSNNDGKSYFHFTCSFTALLTRVSHLTEMGFHIFRVLSSQLSSLHFTFHV